MLKTTRCNWVMPDGSFVGCSSICGPLQKQLASEGVREGMPTGRSTFKKMAYQFHKELWSVVINEEKLKARCQEANWSSWRGLFPNPTNSPQLHSARQPPSPPPPLQQQQQTFPSNPDSDEWGDFVSASPQDPGHLDEDFECCSPLASTPTTAGTSSPLTPSAAFLSHSGCWSCSQSVSPPLSLGPSCTASPTSSCKSMASVRDELCADPYNGYSPLISSISAAPLASLAVTPTVSCKSMRPVLGTLDEGSHPMASIPSAAASIFGTVTPTTSHKSMESSHVGPGAAIRFNCRRPPTSPEASDAEPARDYKPSTASPRVELPSGTFAASVSHICPRSSSASSAEPNKLPTAAPKATCQPTRSRSTGLDHVPLSNGRASSSAATSAAFLNDWASAASGQRRQLEGPRSAAAAAMMKHAPDRCSETHICTITISSGATQAVSHVRKILAGMLGEQTGSLQQQQLSPPPQQLQQQQSLLQPSPVVVVPLPDPSIEEGMPLVLPLLRSSPVAVVPVPQPTPPDEKPHQQLQARRLHSAPGALRLMSVGAERGGEPTTAATTTEAAPQRHLRSRGSPKQPDSFLHHSADNTSASYDAASNVADAATAACHSTLSWTTASLASEVAARLSRMGPGGRSFCTQRLASLRRLPSVARETEGDKTQEGVAADAVRREAKRVTLQASLCLSGRCGSWDW